MSSPTHESHRSLRVITSLMLGGMLVISFCVDWRLVTTGGSIDYRNRITGARLLAKGHEPFAYKWLTGEPNQFCDPFNNPAMKVSQTTVTPTMLAIIMPVAKLRYKAAQVVWLVAQWLLLLGTGAIWWRLLDPGWKRWVWGFVVAGFTFTLAWRHHIDRGQVYILLAFLVALWVSLTKSGGPARARWAGVVAGLLICLRPPFLLFLAPVILLRARSQWPAALLSTCVFALLPMPFRISIWQDYYSGMKGWSELYRNGEKPRPQPQAYPAVVEGVKIETLATYHVRQYADSSLFRILKGKGILGFPDWPLTLCLVACAGLWFLARRHSSLLTLLAGVAVWTFLSDWFLPAYRNPYNDLLAMSLLALALHTGRKCFWVALLALPAGWLLYQILPPARWHIYVPTLLLLPAAFEMLFAREVVRKTGPA